MKAYTVRVGQGVHDDPIVEGRLSGLAELQACPRSCPSGIDINPSSQEQLSSCPQLPTPCCVMLLTSTAAGPDLLNVPCWLSQGEEEDVEAAEGDDQHHEGGIEIIDGQPAPRAGGPAVPRARITTRYMTKFERARVLGTRALQIRYGNSGHSTAEETASDNDCMW